MMKKGFLASAWKKGEGISSSPPQEKKNTSSHTHSQPKNPNNGIGLFLVRAVERNAKVEFTHPRCRTQITGMVDKQALDRGLVVVRCSGCDDLVPLADHGHFFGDGAHHRVEMILRVLGLTVPPQGSYSPLCATFHGPDWKPDKDFLKNSNESTLVAACERDAPVTITHQRCHTQNSRMVDKQALERGVVIIRCSGCDEFVPIADHAFFFQRGTHGEVEEYLHGIRGSYNIPAKGSNNSFCATYEPLDWFARKTGKIPGPVADETATHFGWAKEIDNENPKGNGAAFVKKERDHDVGYTHPVCTTKLVRKVSREAFERGVVVARCTGCNQLVSLADHIGWFGRLHHPSSLENFLTNFRGEIKQGSENTFCVTAETMDFCHTQRKQGKK